MYRTFEDLLRSLRDVRVRDSLGETLPFLWLFPLHLQGSLRRRRRSIPARITIPPPFCPTTDPWTDRGSRGKWMTAFISQRPNKHTHARSLRTIFASDSRARRSRSREKKPPPTKLVNILTGALFPQWSQSCTYGGSRGERCCWIASLRLGSSSNRRSMYVR